jgi:hypothetical protein
MILEEFRKITGKTKPTTSKFYRLRCDNCGVEYEKYANMIHGNKNHFCGSICHYAFGQTEEANEKNSTSNRGRVFSDLTRERISVANKGKVRSKEAREKMRVGHLGKKLSEVHKQSLSIAKKGKPQTRELIKKRADANRGQKRSLETKMKISSVKSDNIASGKTIQTTTFSITGRYFSTKTNTVERFDSLYELMYMQILDADKNVLTWTKKHGIRVLYESQGTTRNYVPDFYQKNVDMSEMITEIKGRLDDNRIIPKRIALENYCMERKINSNFIDGTGLSILLDSVGKLFSSVYAECRNNMKLDKNFYLQRQSDVVVI